MVKYLNGNSLMLLLGISARCVQNFIKFGLPVSPRKTNKYAPVNVTIRNTDGQTEVLNWDKTCFGFSSAWDVNIWKDFTCPSKSLNIFI